jgi:phosphohistidine phosphatase SixA
MQFETDRSHRICEATEKPMKPINIIRTAAAFNQRRARQIEHSRSLPVAWLVIAAIATGLVLFKFGTPDAQSGDPNQEIWELLRSGGQVVVMRHATTVPGFGDPPGFRLEDCTTQRNLSQVGRETARRIGETFRRREVPVGRVLSSQWCRCLETARLAFGTAEPWPALNSFFQDRSSDTDQTRAVRDLVSRPFSGPNIILVTHQVNVTALTGIFPAQGEMVVITPGDGGAFRVAGRLSPAAEGAE